MFLFLEQILERQLLPLHPPSYAYDASCMVVRLENLDAKETSLKKLLASKISWALRQKIKKGEKMKHSRQK